jgi:CubicO group peptidase (beta-lactamase class C family)
MSSPSLIRSSQAASARRIATLVLGASLALIVVGLLQASSAGASSESAPVFAAIDRYVQKEMQDTRMPGVALGIVRGDAIIHLKGFGEADSSRRAVTSQTPVIIGSTSKSFTALAIMQLVEAGKVELDAPVQRYIPWFRVANEDASARITVRHLLNHTSGLSRASGGEALLARRQQQESFRESSALAESGRARPAGRQELRVFQPELHDAGPDRAEGLGREL